MSVENYARSLLKVSVSQMLHTIGFQTAQSTALEILVEILERYIFLISQTSRNFCEFSNRTTPCLDDLACSFNKHKISLNDLEEYINWVDTPEFALSKHLSKQPVDSTEEDYEPVIRFNLRSAKTVKEQLGYCDDPTNKELLDRSSEEEFEHVYDYFPLMTRVNAEVPIVESVGDEALNQPRFDSNIDMLESEDKTIQKDGVDGESMMESAAVETLVDVVKNGVTYENNSWNSTYRSKFAKDYFLRKTHVSPQATVATASATEKQTGLRPPVAKQNTFFHKPRLEKYEKKIFVNAITALNKTSTLPMTDAEMLSSFKLKSNKDSLSSMHQAMVDEISQGAFEDQQSDGFKQSISFSGLKGIKPSDDQADIELGEIKNVNEYMEPTEEQIELMNQEELLGTEIASESLVSTKSKVDKLIQDQIKKHSSPQLSPSKLMTSTSMSMTPVLGQKPQGIKLKIKDNAVMDSDDAQTSFKKPHTQHSKLNLVIKKNSDSSSSVVVNKQSSISTTRRLDSDEQPSIPKLKITSKGSSNFSLDNFFGSNNEPTGKAKLQMQSEFKPIMFDNDNEENNDNVSMKGKLTANSSRYGSSMIESRLGQFEEDENAMDSSMFNSKKVNKSSSSTGTVLGSNRNEPLIWKPVFNTGNTSNSEESNECGKSNFNESPAAVPPPLSAFSTKSASAERRTFKSKAIVDYSSNSNDSVSSSKMIAVDKEKSQGTRLSPIPQTEEEQAEVNPALANVISSGGSSTKREEKKKKKKKNKEKEKEKKHKKNKDKDKEKHKSGADNTGDDATRDDIISRKKDKKLKKELKKQKKLEKLANSNSSFPEDTQNEAQKSPEKCSMKMESSSLVENVSKADETTVEVDHQDSDKEAVRNPQLSLKISKGNLVKTSGHNEPKASKPSTQDESQQPRLPKLKLKIGGSGPPKPNPSGSSNTSLNQDRTKSPMNTPSTSMSLNQPRSLTPTNQNQKMVKPIKISLLNKTKSQGPGMDALKSGEKLSSFASNLMAMKSKSNINPNDASPEQIAALLKKFNQNSQKPPPPPHIEDEPELGEIVRPKPTFPNQMTKEQMLQRQQQRKSLPGGLQKRPMGQNQQGQVQGKPRPPSMQQSFNSNPNEQKRPQGAEGNSEQVPKLVIKQNKVSRPPNQPGSSSSFTEGRPNIKNPSSTSLMKKPGQKPPAQQQQSASANQQQQRPPNQRPAQPNQKPMNSQRPKDPSMQQSLAKKQQIQQQQQQQRQEQQQLANLASALPNLAMSQLQSQLQSLGLPPLPLGIGDQSQFPFPFPPLGLGQFSDPNFTEQILNFLSQQSQQTNPSTSNKPDSSSDSTKVNVKKRKHTEFESHSAQYQNELRHNRSLTKSPVPTQGGSSANKSFHGGAPSTSGNSNNFVRSKSNITPQQSKNRPNMLAARSITPNSMPRPSMPNPNRSGTPNSQQNRSGTPNSQQNRSATSNSQLNRSNSSSGSQQRTGTPNSQQQNRSVTPNSQKNRSTTPSQMNRSGLGQNFQGQKSMTPVGDNNDLPLNLSKKSDTFNRNHQKDSRDRSNDSTLDKSGYEINLDYQFNQLLRQEDHSAKKQLNNAVGTHQQSVNALAAFPSYGGLKSQNSSFSSVRKAKMSSRPSIDKIISSLNKSQMNNQSTSQSGSLNSSFNESVASSQKVQDKKKNIDPSRSSPSTVQSGIIPKKQKLSPKSMSLKTLGSKTSSTSSTKSSLSPKNHFLESNAKSETSSKPQNRTFIEEEPLRSNKIQHQASQSDSGQSSSAPMTIIGTVVHVVSNHQVWICPWCSKPDDSVPMIGCDSCDDWYHWHCVGINREPPANQNWYCHKCGNTDNPNAQTKQSDHLKKEHNLINIKKQSEHDEEVDIMVEVEHHFETTDDE